MYLWQMSRRQRFIENLNTVEKKQLLQGKKTGKSSIFRDRCHAILLSNRGYTVDQLKGIFSVAKSTVYNWLNRWDKGGIKELKTQPGQGRKATLCVDNAEHVKVVKKAIKKSAERGSNLLATIEKDLDMEDQLSMQIIRPFLKKLVSYGSVYEEE
jgi:transposase